jgi:hypothetical protein
MRVYAIRVRDSVLARTRFGDFTKKLGEILSQSWQKVQSILEILPICDKDLTFVPP